MATESDATTQGGRLWGWINARFPLEPMLKEHLTEYWTPKNFNVWYSFGVLSGVVLVVQLVSGIFLTMNYKPSSAEAFASVEYIMRDVDWGWLIRYVHSTGASAFFIVVYLHMFRALIGNALVEWIRGDYYISDITLNRFFALHVAALPIVLVFLAIAHILALHTVGSLNPDGIEIHDETDERGIPKDGIPFHPYFTVKDTFVLGIFLLLFCGVVFFEPTFNGLFLEPPNFEQANPMQTPPHIAPVWYFTPFYAMLRAVPSFMGTQVWGVLVMFAAIVLLFFLPWLDRSPVKSVRYKGPLTKIALATFAVTMIVLGVCGLKPAVGIYPTLARVFTVVYFAFFLLMPWYSRLDPVKPVPRRVTYHAH